MRSSNTGFGIFLLLILASSCSEKDLEEQEPTTLRWPADAARFETLWNRGLMELDQHRFADAAESFSGIVAAMPEEADAWVNLGIAQMNGVTPELFRAAEASYREVLRRTPTHLHAQFCLGVLLKHLGRSDEAEVQFQSVLKKDPHDPTANYYLATLLVPKKEFAAAEKLLETALASEPHLSSAILQLFRVFQRTDRSDAGASLLKSFQEFELSKTANKAGIIYQEMGRYGEGIRRFPKAMPKLRSAAAYSVDPRPGFGTPKPAARPATVIIPANVRPLEALRQNLLPHFGPGLSLADFDGDGDLDVYLADPESLGHLLRNDKGVFTEVTSAVGLVGRGQSVSGVFGDLDNDGDPEIYIACAGSNRLFWNEGGRFTDVTEKSKASGGDAFTAHAVMADLDADGDLDIYCAQIVSAETEAAPNARVWPNEVPSPKNVLLNNNRDGTFVDIAERTGTAVTNGSSIGVFASDLDLDHDPDLLVFRAGLPPLLFRNDRIWRFAEVGDLAGLSSVPDAEGGLAEDLDNDGDFDLVLLGAKGVSVFENLQGLRFAAAPRFLSALSGQRSAVCGDFDLDQRIDVLTLGSKGLQLHRGEVSTAVPLRTPIETHRTLLAADTDHDGVLDLLTSSPGPSLSILRGQLDGPSTWLALDLRGVREEGKMRANTGGVGAVVEIVSGTGHDVREVRTASGVLGGPAARLHFGLAGRKEADYVRTVWPDDVIQSESQVSSGQIHTMTQVYRKGSSCPLLFAWDGARFEFITDFLGTGGLGFFLEPGVYAPPDSTEDVAIPGLVPKDGVLELRIHEPMEEVVYLDEASLLVIDHPEGTEALPDERLAVNAPAPTGEILCFETRARIYPNTLETKSGPADVSTVLSVDRIYQPGVHPDRRFLGYAASQEVVLDFGRALSQFPKDQRLALLLEGWVEYPYSHVNFAALQAGLRFTPLSLDVEVEPGRFEPFAEELGYPAGMPRTMTLDVTALPRHGTGRIRLRTNIELYIDRIAIAPLLPAGSATWVKVDADSALLRRSGYPREYSPDGREPLLYDYALMDPAIEFKNLSGAYTSFGDVRPLLTEADDRYVIMGRGEEIALRFLPPAVQSHDRVRSYILRSAGWCKDMDLYTAFPHTVEPLPFRAMTNYPYPTEEASGVSELFRSDLQTWHQRQLSGSRGSRR